MQLSGSYCLRLGRLVPSSGWSHWYEPERAGGHCHQMGQQVPGHLRNTCWADTSAKDWHWNRKSSSALIKGCDLPLIRYPLPLQQITRKAKPIANALKDSGSGLIEASQTWYHLCPQLLYIQLATHRLLVVVCVMVRVQCHACHNQARHLLSPTGIRALLFSTLFNSAVLTILLMKYRDALPSFKQNKMSTRKARYRRADRATQHTGRRISAREAMDFRWKKAQEPLSAISLSIGTTPMFGDMFVKMDWLIY